MDAQGWRLSVLLIALGLCAGCSAQRQLATTAPRVSPQQHRIPDFAADASEAANVVADGETEDEPAELQQAVMLIGADDAAAPTEPADENSTLAIDAAVPITEHDCMCRAASHSPEVAIILLETCLPTPPDCKKGPSPAEVQRQQLIRLRAAEAANRAAGLSLQAFYGLAEARLQRDLIATSLVKIDEAIADLDSFRDQGIAVAVNRNQLILQRSALLQKRAEAETAIISANSSLKLLLGESPASDLQYAPQTDDLVLPSIDRNQATWTAVAQRPDLNAARLVLRSLTQDSADAAVGLLQQAYPGSTIPVTGGACPLVSLLAIHGSQETLAVRRRQAQTLVSSMERSAVDEVVRFSQQVFEHVEGLAIAEEERSRIEQRIIDLRDLRESGRSTYFDVVRAELQAIESNSEVVRRRYAVETAFARLREAEGGLAVECGWIRACAPLSGRAAPELQEPLPLMPASHQESATDVSLTIEEGMAKCFLK